MSRRSPSAPFSDSAASVSGLEPRVGVRVQGTEPGAQEPAGTFVARGFCLFFHLVAKAVRWRKGGGVLAAFPGRLPGPQRSAEAVLLTPSPVDAGSEGCGSCWPGTASLRFLRA